MEQKEYLSEATYQKNKKKITTLALIIFLIGLVIGGGLITFGIIKTNELKAENAAKIDEIKASQSGRTEAQIQTDIDETQAKMEALDTEINNLRSQQQQAFMDNGFDDTYYELDRQINSKENERLTVQRDLSGYKLELQQVEAGFNDHEIEQQEAKNKISESKYVPFYMIGGFVIVAAVMVALVVYMMAKRREIMAFQMQQVMPVAQEGITKMAPTVGKAAGTVMENMGPAASKAMGSIAKDIASGIKEGLRNDPSQDSQDQNKQKQA